MAKVNVNKLLHSTYGVSVTKFGLVHSQYGAAGYTNRKICLICSTQKLPSL